MRNGVVLLRHQSCCKESWNFVQITNLCCPQGCLILDSGLDLRTKFASDHTNRNCNDKDRDIEVTAVWKDMPATHSESKIEMKEIKSAQKNGETMIIIFFCPGMLPNEYWSGELLKLSSRNWCKLQIKFVRMLKLVRSLIKVFRSSYSCDDNSRMLEIIQFLQGRSRMPQCMQHGLIQENEVQRARRKWVLTRPEKRKNEKRRSRSIVRVKTRLWWAILYESVMGFTKPKESKQATKQELRLSWSFVYYAFPSGHSFRRKLH